MDVFLYVLSAILPILATGIFLFLDRKVTAFSKLPGILKQVIGGVAFAGCAVGAVFMCIEYIDTSLTSVNASILISSLAIGPISGAITGVVAVGARLLHDFLDNGVLTFYEYSGLVASSVIAIVVPIVKWFLFRKEKVSWYFGLLLGVTFEALWVLAFYMFFLDAPKVAYDVISVMGWKAVVTVASSTGGALLLAGLVDAIPIFLHREKDKRALAEFKLKNILGIGILVSLSATLGLSLGAAFVGQSKTAYNEMSNELTLNANNLADSIAETADLRYKEYSNIVSNACLYYAEPDLTEPLVDAVATLPLTSASYVGADGKIVYSSVPNYIGTDLHTDFGTVGTRLLPLLDEKTSGQTIVLPYASGEDGGKGGGASSGKSGWSNIGMKYAAISFVQNGQPGMIMISSDPPHYTNALDSAINAAAHNRRIGESGFLFITNSASTGLYIVSSGDLTFEGKRLFEVPIVFEADELRLPGQIGRARVNDLPCYYLNITHDDHTIFAIYLEQEMTFQRDSTFYMIAYLLFVVIGVIFLLVFALLDWQVIQKLDRLGDKLEAIAGGNLETKVGHLGNREFNRLAQSVDETIGVLRGYIDRESKRIDHDLALARDLQFGSLPSVEPLLNYHDFKIGAFMTPAKEVGGDFYDFFLLPDGRLAFLVADVSDKGIPAAMFMMRAKAMIHSLCQMRLPCDEVFARTNEDLYERNDLNMFITAWLGVLDRATGELEYVNAGHNPPLIRKGWKYSYLDDDPCSVLGAFSKTPYIRRRLKLKPLDGLFLYTDGVTEATNSSMELFGEDRLRAFLDGFDDFEPDKMCDQTFAVVKKFLGEADQNDDITMVSLTYLGPCVQTDLLYPASVDSFPQFQSDLDQVMSDGDVDEETRANIHICAEEYFINVASYAYPKGKEGEIRVSVFHTPYEWNVSFVDSGVRFNPLSKADPDVNVDFSERRIGGLGIYMVKQIADSVHYDYINRENVNIFGIHTAKGKKEK